MSTPNAAAGGAASRRLQWRRPTACRPRPSALAVAGSDWLTSVTVDHAVDHDVTDMQTLWAELARHPVRYGAQRCLRGSKCRERRARAQRCRRAGKQQRAAALGQHPARRLAANDEPAETTQTPELLEEGIIHL